MIRLSVARAAVPLILLALATVAPCAAMADASGSTVTRAMVPEPAMPMPPDRLTLSAYGCATKQSLQARYLPLSSDERGRSILYLTIDGERVRLLQVPSATGVLYIGGGWQWWTDRIERGMLARLPPDGTFASDLGTLCTRK